MEVMGMPRRKRRPWGTLPDKVGVYVADQLARDWETLAEPCRTVCKDCPADRDAEDSPCLECPFSGLSTLAAIVTLSSKAIRRSEQHIVVDENEKHNI